MGRLLRDSCGSGEVANLHAAIVSNVEVEDVKNDPDPALSKDGEVGGKAVAGVGLEELCVIVRELDVHLGVDAVISRLGVGRVDPKNKHVLVEHGFHLPRGGPMFSGLLPEGLDLLKSNCVREEALLNRGEELGVVVIRLKGHIILNLNNHKLVPRFTLRRIR